MIKNVTLKISDLSCKQCVQAVDYTIKGIQGIISLAISKSGGGRTAVDVSYDSEILSFEKIRDAIVDLGHLVHGYIIHEHSHSHGDIAHNHPHRHGNEGSKLPTFL